MAKIVGYGIAGGGEHKRYLKGTLDEFQRLCDETIILGNNLEDEDRQLIESYGFHLVEDNREWGKLQHVIKHDFLKNHVAKLKPDITICLDMDEVFANVTREKIEEIFNTNQAFYVYIANLWGKGYRGDWSFWNVRMFGWEWLEKLGDSFFEYENRPLHCGLAPKWTYALNIHAPFVLEHHGLKKKKDRMRKVKRYEQYDPRQVYRAPSYYQALKLDAYEPYNRDEVIRNVENHIDEIPQPLNKQPIIRKPNVDKVLVKREADGLVFDIDKKQLPNQLKQKYKGQGFTLVQ